MVYAYAEQIEIVKRLEVKKLVLSELKEFLMWWICM